jgi:CheY-like chemotaxis protein
MKLTLLSLGTGDSIRVRCEGHLTSPRLAGDADPLETLLGPQVYGHSVLMDLERAKGIDTSGICWLLHATERFRKEGGRLVLYRVPPLICDMLNVLRLTEMLLIADDEESACAIEVSTPQGPLGKSVLVVEDDNAAREVAVLLLEGQGYAVTRARDGREALALLRGQPLPDLIVLDLWMPGMNGQQFREHQRTDPALAAIPVLVVSAVADDAEQDGALGEVGFLQKPVAPDDLFAAVARCVGGP